MNFKSVWLIVLTMLMGTASAATVNFNGGSVGNCTLAGSTYTCDVYFVPGGSDILAIASGYTVVLSTAFTPGWSQGLTMSGSAALRTSGSNAIDLSGSNNINVSGGTLTAGGNFKLGSNDQTITANVVAATITTGGSSATINGSVSATGSISLGSKTTISGAVSGASISTNSQVEMGSLSVTGTADLGSKNVIYGAVSADVLTTNSNVTLKGNVNATTSFTLGSGSDMTGNVSAPTVTLNPSNVTVTGNIDASTLLEIGSGNTVTGKVTGGSLLMRPANATINGSVTMTGDVDMGSHSNINGDLKARDVLTRSAFANINGNAAVNSIYIDWNDSVSGVITCTGAGAVGCSCVTKADPNYHPTCGAAPPGAPHHFQINHSGSALTCQAKTVTVIACADANCTTRYNSDVNTTLQPGGQAFTISGGMNSAATVRSTTPGIQILSASGASNATTCVNSGGGKPCEMNFQSAGLTVTATNHVSMAPGALVTIEALKEDSASKTCVPLVYGPATIELACSYQNPASGSVPVGFQGQNATCGANQVGAPVSVPVTFDPGGKATVPLAYGDVGKVGVRASLKSSVNYTGDGDFIAAPAGFQITATNASGRSIGPAPLTAFRTDVFAKASESFTLTVTAVNKANDTAPNFGKESTASQVQIALTINKADDSPVPAPVPGGQAGGIPGVFPAFDKGKSSISTNFDDVGYVKLTATLKDSANSNPVYYMGVPISGFATTGTQYVSRFIPDHFDTALMTADDFKTAKAASNYMSCDGLIDSSNPCKATKVNTSFVNAQQPFFMKVLAYNGAGALTTNYGGALAREITVSAWSANGGDKLPANASTTDAITWSSSAPHFTFDSGIGLITSANQPAFNFAKAYPAADIAPTVIYLRADDTTDKVSSLRSPPNNSVEAPLNIVSGRLLVANAYGSPTSPLKVEARAQYFMPTGYVFNPQVNVSSAEAVSVYLTPVNCEKALKNNDGSCKTINLVDTTAVLKLDNGLGSFRLAAPVPVISGIGSAGIILKKNGKDLIPFLPSTTGKETFGVYRSGPVIYTREIY